MSQFILSALAAAGIAFGATTTSANLYVSSYDGNVTSLGWKSVGSQAVLTANFINRDCGPSPSWLTLDQSTRTLYCLNEGNPTPDQGSITSFKAYGSGWLIKTVEIVTPPAPVNLVQYGDSGRSAIAVAHYSGQLSSIVAENTTLTVQQTLNFTSTPGPIRDRQAGPHPHEAILDPTKQFMLVPDLGADLVRLFCWDPTSDVLAAHDPIQVPAGTGPRHAAFWSPNGSNSTDQLYLMVVGELSNAIIVYSTSYGADGIPSFKQVYTTTSFGNQTVPTGAAAAEIAVSPDNRFILVSNRNDSSIAVKAANGSIEYTDSLATFQPNSDGSLNLVQLWSAGGSFPRQFSINKAGDKVAVALQLSSKVVVFDRDVQSGNLGNISALAQISGQPTSVVWDD
jgi:6-phosphogluconolactonase (cycloisomerase 2 family)